MNILKVIFVLFTILLISFSISADYMARFYLFDIDFKNNVAVVDGNITEQPGGESGEIEFVISRTSGYNHNSFNLIVNSNSYNCFKLETPPNVEIYLERCNVSSYPIISTIDVETLAPGVYNLQLIVSDNYGSPALKTYNFSFEIIAVPADITSDSQLSFGYYRSEVKQGEDFSISIIDSTFECYRINLITEGYGDIETNCTTDFPKSKTINISSYLPTYTGNVQLSVEGFNAEPVTLQEIDNRIYPFTVNLTP